MSNLPESLRNSVPEESFETSMRRWDAMNDINNARSGVFFGGVLLALSIPLITVPLVNEHGNKGDAALGAALLLFATAIILFSLEEVKEAKSRLAHISNTQIESNIPTPPRQV